MHLSYADLEDFLAEIHRVMPSKRTALRGRLKHFQRLGWPAGTNKGKGARVQYGIGQTMCLAVGMEMLQLGLTPERVVSQLRYSGSSLAIGFVEALDEHGKNSDDIFYIFSPESLQSLRSEDEDDANINSLMVSKSNLAGLLQNPELFSNWRRFAFINISAILTEYVLYFSDRGLKSASDLTEPLKNWQVVSSQALEDWQARMISRMQIPAQGGAVDTKRLRTFMDAHAAKIADADGNS